MSPGSSGSRSGAGFTLDRKAEHALKNHLSVILGFCELLIADTAPDDPRHGDLLEIRRSAQTVLAMFAEEADE